MQMEQILYQLNVSMYFYFLIWSILILSMYYFIWNISLFLPYKGAAVDSQTAY